MAQATVQLRSTVRASRDDEGEEQRPCLRPRGLRPPPAAGRESLQVARMQPVRRAGCTTEVPERTMGGSPDEILTP